MPARSHGFVPRLLDRMAALPLLMVVFACERSPGTDTAPAPSPMATADGGDGWMFRPTFEQNLPSGIIGVPLFEAVLPDHAQVRIVAATSPVGASDLAIGVWTYDQRNPREVLELLGPPEPILRLDPGRASSPALARLRRQLAAPGTRVVRPMGLELDAVRAGIEVLQSAARTVTDPNAPARARVEALARLVRGLDDTLVLEADAVGKIAAALGSGSSWEVEDEEALSPRRHVVTARSDRGRHVMTWMKKPGGWVLTEINDP